MIFDGKNKLRMGYTPKTMRLHNTIAITAALIISSAFSAAAQKAVKVEMHDGMGNSVGTAELSPASAGGSNCLALKGVPPGGHRIPAPPVAQSQGPAFRSRPGH